MANKVKLEIMTPSEIFYSGEVEMVIVRTLEGEEGFMAGHCLACKLLAEGEARIKESGSSKNVYKRLKLSGGFIDVKKEIVIYTDEVEWVS